MRCPRFPTSDFGAAQCISNRKAKLVLTYSRQTPRQTADAATLTAKTAINAERAWLRVWLDRIDGNNTRRNVVAMNEGKTPARVTGFQVRTKRVWLDKSEFRHPNVPLDPVNVWVNPKAAEKVGEIDILDLATESSEGKASMGSVLQYHGVVEYIAIIEIDDSGMFPKRHCTSFVYQSSNGSLHERKDLASYT